MDIRNDKSIICIYRRCEICFDIYDAMEDIDVSKKAICCNCLSSAFHGAPKLETPRRKIKTLPSSGYSSLLPYQIPQVRGVLHSIFLSKPNIIIDATAHIGGDTIHFSKLWPESKIISLDIDENAVVCLKQNISHFSSHPENIEVICTDCVPWIRQNMKKADFYYFDPPWGGPTYCSEEEISLCLSDKPISDIINFVLENLLTTKVILKVPRNFAYNKFKTEVKAATTLYYIRKPQKKGSIAYGLILISL